MKQTILFLIIAMALLPLHADLFFSEYIEGGSNNKALEIYNNSDTAVDLDDYYILVLNNGNYTWDNPRYTIDLEGTVPANDVWVICNSSAVTAIQDVSDYIGSSATYFNGDDGVGLFHYDGITWTALDEIGTEADPGSGWAVAGTSNATANHTLVRKDDVTTGTIDWAASAGTDTTDSQWTVYPQDTFTYLGSHGSGSGGDELSIVYVVRDKEVPFSNETVTVTAEITGGVGPYTVDLYYDINETVAFGPISMTETTPGVFEGDIANTPDGSYIYYIVDVNDSATRANVTSDGYDYFSGVTSIADVRQMDALEYPEYDGVPCRVQGVALCDDGTYGTYCSIYLQDSSGGINIYDSSQHGFVMGDEYQVVGTIGQYRGVCQLNYSSSAYIASPGLPNAPTITIADLLYAPETWESQLVRIENVTNIGTTIWPLEGWDTSLTVNDGGAEDLTLRIDQDTNIDGTPEPTWPCVVYGVIGQYDSSSPYDTGYQLTPRFYEDFQPEPQGENTQSVTAGAPGLIGFNPSMTYLQINFTDVATGDMVTGQFNNAAPNGVGGIAQNNVFDYFWTVVHEQLELNPGGATVIIDLDLLPDNGGILPGMEEPGDLFVYTRMGPGDPWQLLAHTYDAVENTISFAVDHFSDFVFANNVVPLPVEMSSFNAAVTSNKTVMLEWVTQSESNMIGYHVLRGDNEQVGQARYITTEPIASQNLSSETVYNHEDTEVYVDNSYYYWLEGVDNDGSTELFGPVFASVIEDEPDDTPEFFELNTLRANFPNPFNPTTTIEYSIRGTEGEAVEAELAIYNIRGQHVRTLFSGAAAPGDHTVTWHGDDDNGHAVGSGMYFYKLTTPGFTQMRKMMLIK